MTSDDFSERDRPTTMQLESLKASLPPSDTAPATTDYLTSKLVQDSLKWQKDHPHAEGSPSGSPRKVKAQSAAVTSSSSSHVRMDPNLIMALENDARHLATSVDNLVENLSGVLQSISAITVETVETYRDGVCKV